MRQYKLSILVALYKAGNFVQSKLQSIINQTIFDDCQLVILNCLNLDNERNIYEKYISLPNVSVIEYNEYKYLYDTWNDGINITNSEYITNANVDDQWHPEFAEQCTNYLDNRHDISIVSTNILVTHIAHQLWPNWEYHDKFPQYVYPNSTAGP